MKTTSSKDTIYIGRNSGQYILEEIRTAKNSVKIVSPYLSASYLEELIALHRKGVSITLITCDKIVDGGSYSSFTSSDLVVRSEQVDPFFVRVRKKGMFFSSIFLFVILVFLLQSFFFSFLFYPSVILFFLGFVSLVYFYFRATSIVTLDTLFRIKVFDSASGEKPWSTELIHSKLYVIDDRVAFVGSANFTYSGFVKHYDTVVNVEDLKAVQSISQEIEVLFDSKELRAKEIEEWMGF